MAKVATSANFTFVAYTAAQLSEIPTSRFPHPLHRAVSLLPVLLLLRHPLKHPLLEEQLNKIIKSIGDNLVSEP